MARVTKKSSTDQRLDDLYREHPDGFVSARNELAKDLRSASDRGESDRIKKLRRPTAAAWLINHAALESPKQLKEFADASKNLERAQGRALEGDDEGADEWRAAATRERDAIAATVELAERLAREAGHPASERALELAGQTLRAATADPELRERVVSGRLERERSGATLGTPAAAPPPKGERKSARRQARRDLDRLEADLAEATAREDRLRAQVDRTTEALREEKAKLAESKRATAVLKRQLKAAQRRANG
jgi:DNA repair exonuclease SbcCD ATPase subunit